MIDLSDAPMWLIWAVAVTAAATLLSAIHLLRRSRSSRGAGVALLFVSILFHAALIFGLPMLTRLGGEMAKGDQEGHVDADDVEPTGAINLSLSMFETLPAAEPSDVDSLEPEMPLPMGPLPIDPMSDLGDSGRIDPTGPLQENEFSSEISGAETAALQSRPLPATPMPATPLAANFDAGVDEETSRQLDRWLDETEPDEHLDQSVEKPREGQIAELNRAAPLNDAEPADDAEPPIQAEQADEPESLNQIAVSTPNDAADSTHAPVQSPATTEKPALPSPVAATMVASSRGVASLADDFAARKGSAKQIALQRTGGDQQTEAAVAAALQFLSRSQKQDGGWGPAASDAGRERSPLGFRRGGAGTKAETAITGLSLLAMMGAGHTHQDGEHADSVYKGLSRLMSLQKPDGSLAGDASIYSATYCHGMAALAVAEAAAMTGDRSAIDSATRAVDYTETMQHPHTGGWRYTKGDPGDLSQLGWQAMVLDGAHRAGIAVKPSSVRGIERFLNTVRAGRSGGLASYRHGELPSRTMTAESLATHLLLGLPVTDEAIVEAERYMLADLPGRGVDNYYYWYYATLALHQLQDDAWLRWNEALKRRLLMTQRSDGSWPADSLWGGYGGTIYTTSMATLCLETYYRHVVRQEAKMARTTDFRR